jgi:hypothetical protein
MVFFAPLMEVNFCFFFRFTRYSKSQKLRSFFFEESFAGLQYRSEMRQVLFSAKVRRVLRRFAILGLWWGKEWFC